jgi:hypothetical protein
MPNGSNPLGLDTRTLRALTILQKLAREARPDQVDTVTGDITLSSFPGAGSEDETGVPGGLASTDAEALRAHRVWDALERARLARSFHPTMLTLTPAGQGYETGLKLPLPGEET